jgi:hypothetical protein
VGAAGRHKRVGHLLPHDIVLSADACRAGPTHWHCGDKPFKESVMSIVAWFVAMLAVLPAFGLVAWAWLSLNGLKDDEGLLLGFECLHRDPPTPQKHSR